MSIFPYFYFSNNFLFDFPSSDYVRNWMTKVNTGHLTLLEIPLFIRFIHSTPPLLHRRLLIHCYIAHAYFIPNAHRQVILIALKVPKRRSFPYCWVRHVNVDWEKIAGETKSFQFNFNCLAGNPKKENIV